MTALKTSRLLFIVSIAFLLTASSFLPVLQPGEWRGEFITGNHRIPFNFIVDGGKKGPVKVYLKNGEERALLDSVYFRSDSVIFPVDIYDAFLIAKINGDSLKGYFRRNGVNRKGLPFSAAHNQKFRFITKDKAKPVSVQGKWSVNLITERDGKFTTRYTIGLLEQQGNVVTGTILTTTGDYRYLEGVIDGGQLKLSAFSGSNPSLIEAELTGKDQLKGQFISPGGITRLEAIRNDTAKLPDPYRLTYLKPGYEKLSFSFPDLNGKTVSLQDDKYKGKVVIVTIGGSWCPNCIDEAAFLGPWYKKNKSRGVEIINLSFERKDDFAFAKSRLAPFMKRFDIQYDVLFAGAADKKVVAEKLPELNTFLSFPTTFFIDKQGKVRKVHTGYTGPAAGKYYDEFIDEFNSEVNALLNENSKEGKTRTE